MTDSPFHNHRMNQLSMKRERFHEEMARIERESKLLRAGFTVIVILVVAALMWAVVRRNEGEFSGREGVEETRRQGEIP